MIAVEPAGEDGVPVQPSSARQSFELIHISGVAVAREDQAPGAEQAAFFQGRKGFDQHLESLFWMNARKSQNIRIAADLRLRRVEWFRSPIDKTQIEPVRNHHAARQT